MSTRLVHRPARTARPAPPQQPLAISPPPVLPEGKTASGMQSILPLSGAGMSMMMMMFFRGSGFMALGAIVMVLSMAAMGLFYFSQRGQATRKRRHQRERYMTYLEELREELREAEQRAQRDSLRVEPPPDYLLTLIHDPARLWERRRRDDDFLRVRVGVGAVPGRELTMRMQDTPVNPADPFMVAEARALVRRFSEVPGLPLRVDLDRAGDVSVVGARREQALEVARAVIAQVAACHAPDDVALAVIAPPEAEPDWAWARWLPHLIDREHIGAAGPQPRMSPDVDALLPLLATDLTERARHAAQSYRHGSGAAEAATRQRLVIVDDAWGDVARQLPVPDQATDLAALGITVVHLVADRLDEPSDVSARITIDGDDLTVESLRDGDTVAAQGTPDRLPLALAEGLARELAPLRLSADSYDDGTGTPPADLPALLGVGDPARLDIANLWRPRGERDFLRVPIGVNDAGHPVLLDLKESAQLGMGPHGLCVGVTGSGKSELLRGLVLALAATHPPEQVTLMLVDYKGGATFAPFAELPHVAGLLTNLAADAALVERMYTSLDGEVLRRQQLLADAGKLTDIVEYTMVRAERGGAGMPPLPYLIVIIDEFGELLTAKPEFVELFLRIGRIGRALGIHLLLASQRVESGKLRGLETYLSYRLGLRTLSDSESRAVLDTPDAASLPSVPGFGYLKVDVTIYERFKTAHVSGPLRAAEEEEPAPAAPAVLPMPRYGTPEQNQAATALVPRATVKTTGPTLLSTVVQQLVAAGVGRRARSVWLPPLPDRVTLDQVGGGFDITPLGVRLRVAPTDDAGLTVPVGVLDDPAAQWQGPWLLDMSGAGGNVIVLGGPAAGKTTLLRTMALGLAASHTPTEVGIYAVDLLAGGLRDLAGLPHVGGVAGRDSHERVRRTVDEVHAMLDERERVFQRHQIDTVGELRAARAAGRVTELACTDIILMIDGYGQLAGEFESLESKVHELLTRGGRYGVHVVATARRWNEVRMAQQVSFGNRVELRLTDPAESSIDAKLARTISDDRPGRALTTDKLTGQVALPRLDGIPDLDSGALAGAATMIRSTWHGPLPPPVRVLPSVLAADDMAGVAAEPGAVPLGRFEADFAPAVLDLFGRDQHLLVLGDTGTGKTNLLRLVGDALIKQFGDDELVFAVFDPRHGLVSAIPEAYLGGYASNTRLANQLALAVARELERRDQQNPGQAVASPRIVLLVDDYDVLSASATQPLAPFVPYLAAGRDLGLHVVMARRVMGAARGLYEPFTTSVRESGCLSLLMSGDRSEGQLFPGIRPTTLPAGRAQLIRPGDPAKIVQTAYLDPHAQPTGHAVTVGARRAGDHVLPSGQGPSVRGAARPEHALEGGNGSADPPLAR